ncbi:MAG TPA: type II toxin-antitoxin system VapC family toxin [Planctomycetota bacterium]|nr:type II toxin-antitoxin system VapC family toxin [Planctomycetota bacterium]
MKRVVLDASITVASCVGEEEAAELSDAVLELLHEGVAVVPGVWLGEVANAFVAKERTGRREHKLTADETSAFLAFVGRLPVVIDWTTQETTFGAVAKLARESGLTTTTPSTSSWPRGLVCPWGASTATSARRRGASECRS